MQEAERVSLLQFEDVPNQPSLIIFVCVHLTVIYAGYNTGLWQEQLAQHQNANQLGYWTQMRSTAIRKKTHTHFLATLPRNRSTFAFPTAFSEGTRSLELPRRAREAEAGPQSTVKGFSRIWGILCWMKLAWLTEWARDEGKVRM